MALTTPTGTVLMSASIINVVGTVPLAKARIVCPLLSTVMSVRS